MLLIIQIASGILLAFTVYKGTIWIVRKVKDRIEEEKFVNALAAQIKLDKEGEGDWLRSTPKKD